MTETLQICPAPIRRSFTVKASAERAFEVFARMGSWWIPSHSIAPSGMADCIIEPREGGRWYEKGHEGEECQWGEVVTWDPPRKLVLIWGLSAQWSYDPALRTEIEVRFTPEGEGTRVEFEHRKLEAYGADAVAMAETMSRDGGWTALMAAFAAEADA